MRTTQSASPGQSFDDAAHSSHLEAIIRLSTIRLSDYLNYRPIDYQSSDDAAHSTHCMRRLSDSLNSL